MSPVRDRGHSEFLSGGSFSGRKRLSRECSSRFVNHHEAHALAALFFTDWDDALIYTLGRCRRQRQLQHARAQGEASSRSLLSVMIAGSFRPCPVRASRMLVQFATEACRFRRLRHEGKLTGLAAFWRASLAPELADCFSFGKDGLITAEFKTWDEMGDRIKRFAVDIHARTLLHRFKKSSGGHYCPIGALLAQANGNARHLALAGGLFANVRLNRFARRDHAGRGDFHPFPNGRRRTIGRVGASHFACARRACRMALQAPAARQRLSWAEFRRPDRCVPGASVWCAATRWRTD